MDPAFNSWDAEELEDYLEHQAELAVGQDFLSMQLCGNADFSVVSSRHLRETRRMFGVPVLQDMSDVEFDSDFHDLQSALIENYAYVRRTLGRPPPSVYSLPVSDPRSAHKRKFGIH